MALAHGLQRSAAKEGGNSGPARKAALQGRFEILDSGRPDRGVPGLRGAGGIWRPNILRQAGGLPERAQSAPWGGILGIRCLEIVPYTPLLTDNLLALNRDIGELSGASHTHTSG